MAATEDDIIRDEQERNNLLRAIADVETAIAVSTPGTRRVLENTRDNAMRRIATLDKRIEEAKVERATEVQLQAAATAALVAKEKGLSAAEQETYGGFLKETFFTKKDFGKLEQFYAHSWDRLTEGGKDEMSHRVWEGVRHGEYRFTDLPKDVRAKEEDRLYKKLTTSSKEHESLDQIRETDRNDFVRAYKAGNREEVGRILNHESFRASTALGTSAAVLHRPADVERKGGDDKSMVQTSTEVGSPATAAASTSMIGKVDVDALSLTDLKLADASAPPSAANIPSATGKSVPTRT